MSSQIIYNSKTLTLTKLAYRFDPARPHVTLPPSRAASGKVEVLTVRVDESVSVGFRNFVKGDSTDDTQKRNIKQFTQWAQAGNAWYFALDSAEKILTTLSASAAVGATSLSLTSIVGIVVGRTYVVRSETARDFVKVLTAGAGVVTLAEGLNFAFASGDRFRSEFYWPARMEPTLDPIIERPPLFWDLGLDFTEDVNAL